MGGSKKQDSSISDAGAGIQAAGRGLTEATKMTGDESAQYKSSFELGKLMEQIMKYQQGLGAAPSGYMSGEQQYQQGGPLAQSYYNQTLAGTQDPYGAYESSLQPALQLAGDTINRNMQQRGLMRSGMNIEQMGRSGVDLAIKEAQQRMQFRAQELARGGELSQYGNQLQQQNLSNMGSLYGQEQGYGLTAMQRQATGAGQAAQYQAYPSQAAMGSAYGQQAGNQAGMYQLGGSALGALGTLGAAYINPYSSMVKLGSAGSTTV